MYGTIDNLAFRIPFTAILLILATIFYKWIRKQMKQYLTSEAIDAIIKSKDAEIEHLKSRLAHISKINHNYSHRIAALEAAEEITPDLAKAAQNLSKDFKNESMLSINTTPLPSTNVYEIDNILTYMSKKADADNIELNLKLNDSINYMLEHLISQKDLITLISNHIQNSIIAINWGTKESKRILVLLGLMDNCYEFSVNDTGIEFEIDTLITLGLKQTTTHKETGGSGIGLMTTFEILKECKASLIIEEYKPSNVGYTKAVIIKFDNKNEYIIKSYRADEIRLKDNENRLNVVSL